MTRRILLTLALVAAPALAAAQQPTTPTPQQPTHADSAKAHTMRMRHAAKKKGTAAHKDSTARHDTTKAKPKS